MDETNTVDEIMQTLQDEYPDVDFEFAFLTYEQNGPKTGEIIAHIPLQWE